jgi:hypothetical protein
MDQSDAQALLRYLLSQDGAAVRAWIEAVESGEGTVPAGFNWHGLAQVAAADAQRYGDLTWAGVATFVYDQLARQAPQGESSDFAHSAMQLRAWMIARFGPRADDPVLDLDRVLRWVRAGLIMPPDEAARRATAWKEAAPEQKQQQREQVRQLRDMKNRLAVVELLVGSSAGILDDDLRRWLEIRPALP